ncbi:MAG TPA: hypothetical protein VGN18_06040 [Jatrophihabitans sp.]|jgi:hypothetical protein|uniref:hypothetical protein n=1 Tax=Jatrophihabitans sp. TaxID=1932789 RepID=UPI002E05C7B1|nr:hypothetical protein [Jatrophihabitans sp.]
MTTGHRLPPTTSAPRSATPWLGRAWTAVALVPVFFLIAFAVGEIMYAVLGYQPENADAPTWAVVVALGPTLVVALTPCLAAMLFGHRATRAGDRRGLVPLALGAIAGTAILVLTVVSEVGDAIRR